MIRHLGVAAMGISALLVVLELLFRAIPVSTATMTGYHHWPGVVTYPSGHQWTVSTGWDLRNPQRLRANASGFVSSREFLPDPAAVALVGDSYVEASMLDAADRPGNQLEQQLGGRPVFAMGGPGSSLLDYAHRLTMAQRAWGLQAAVVMVEPADVRQSLCGSGNVHGRCLDPQTRVPQEQLMPAPGKLKALLRYSALAQYLVGHVRLGSLSVWQTMFTRQTPVHPGSASPASSRPDAEAAAAADALVGDVLQEFFKQVPPALHGKLLFVLDGQRPMGPKLGAQLQLERAGLLAQLRARGAVVVDLEQVFAQHAVSSRRLLEVGPHDGHLNALGVRLAMAAAARQLAP